MGSCAPCRPRTSRPPPAWQRLRLSRAPGGRASSKAWGPVLTRRAWTGEGRVSPAAPAHWRGRTRGTRATRWPPQLTDGLRAAPSKFEAERFAFTAQAWLRHLLTWSVVRPRTWRILLANPGRHQAINCLMLPCTVGLLAGSGQWAGSSVHHPHLLRPWNPIRASAYYP